eukprot:14941806-Alexandrium_andersonii.AAC.1
MAAAAAAAAASAAVAALASSAARCAACSASAFCLISSACFSAHAASTARDEALKRHTTFCPAATHTPSPSSRAIRPQRQRATSINRRLSSNPTALILQTAVARSSSN